MIISGTRKRSIADQTDTIDFSFRVTPNETTGSYLLGVSGTNRFGITFASGVIYDPNNQSVATYQSQIPVNISGQLNQQSFDLWVNERLVVMGQTWQTGKYSWLFAHAQLGSFDFQGGIKGVLPNYTLEQTGRYSASGQLVSGKIVNNTPARAFRIFNAYLEQTDTPYAISAFTTGDITTTGRVIFQSDLVGLQDYVLPLVLETNFGQLRYNFTISGDYSLVPDVYLNLSPDTPNVIDGIAKGYTLQISNFPSGTRIGVELAYNSGITGNIYFFQDQTRTGLSKNASGTIVGCGYLTDYGTGLVSGLDPKTAIYEIGTGSGWLRSPLICATGNVSQSYTTRLSGLGSGALNLDYTASGLAYGMFTGNIPLTGGYVPSLAFNYLGTGDSPGIAIGTVPLGTGIVLVYPTGCFPISSGLISGVDYFAGVLTYDKVFSGPLALNYSIVSIGFGTGAFLSGVVDSNFIKNFEQGQYVFRKNYSGLVFSRTLNSGTFDPSLCIEDIDSRSSGVLNGIFPLAATINCSSLQQFNSIPVTGYPSAVFGSNGEALQPNNVVLVMPSGGFSTNENLDFRLSGNYTRTMISHAGATLSGTGYFASVVNSCETTGVWKGTVTGLTSGSGKIDSYNNTFKKVSTQVYLTGSGNFGDTGQFVGEDSGIIFFAITGAGYKTMAFRGINVESPDNRVLSFYLFKNALSSDIWGAEGINDSVAFRQWETEVMDGVDPFRDSVVVLENLQSGIYGLYVVSRPLQPPIVYFKQSLFTGCESAGNLRIDIAASGELRNPIWFELMEYEEITAHSGRNYSPVYIPSGFFLPSISGEQLFSFTIPIYDDHTFGKDHEFIMRLSNCSGCNFALQGQEATGRILENDNGSLPTGLYPQTYPVGAEFVDWTGFITGEHIYDCSFVSPILPPQPPVFDPPSFSPPPVTCPDCTPPPCCECENLAYVSGNCPGYPTAFTGWIVTGYCGMVTAEGVESTNGYIYIGEICSAKGTVYQDYKAGSCDIYVKVIPDGCAKPLFETGPSGGGCNSAGAVCPQIGDGWDISGFDPTFTICSGSCNQSNSGNLASGGSSTVTGCQTYSVVYCPDYAQYLYGLSGRQFVKKRPVGDPCRKEHVFINVVCTHHDTEAWSYTGMTVPVSPQSLATICPPRPI